VKVIRHTALFVWAGGVTDDEKTRVKDGVAYCYYGSDLLALDFGEDLGLAPTRHRFALQHDHGDRGGWDAYNENAAHHRVGAVLRSLTRPELAARVDWVYEGPPSRRGAIRQLSLYRWDEAAGEQERSEALAAAAALPGRCPSIRALELGADLGWYPPNYDWIVEAHFDDLDGLAVFGEHPARREAEAAARAATHSDLTAQIQYRMLSG
jgi:Stress responsive A/B Barrel Domain